MYVVHFMVVMYSDFQRTQTIARLSENVMQWSYRIKSVLLYILLFAIVKVDILYLSRTGLKVKSTRGSSTKRSRKEMSLYSHDASY